jgi:hypothetical protein
VIEFLTAIAIVPFVVLGLEAIREVYLCVVGRPFIPPADHIDFCTDIPDDRRE